jgi:hypothetical protein
MATGRWVRIACIRYFPFQWYCSTAVEKLRRFKGGGIASRGANRTYVNGLMAMYRAWKRRFGAYRHIQGLQLARLSNSC